VFWRDVSERVIASFAGSLLTSFPVVQYFDPLTVGWKIPLGVALGSSLFSLLKALAASGVGDPQSASLVPSAPALTSGRHEKK
jgi:hypothetical protein